MLNPRAFARPLAPPPWRPAQRCVAWSWHVTRVHWAVNGAVSVIGLCAQEGGGFWSIRSEHRPGDMGFDPLRLMPADAEARRQMETKELNHGRLAMIGISGMVAQELVTTQKLF